MALILLECIDKCYAEVKDRGGYLLDRGRTAVLEIGEDEETIIKLWPYAGEDGASVIRMPKACGIRAGKNGNVTARGCTVIVWDKLLHVLLKPESIPRGRMLPPEKLSQCKTVFGGREVTAELYRDNGTRIALMAQNGSLAGYYAAGCESEGEISRLLVGKKSYLAVRLYDPNNESFSKRQRLLIVDESMETVLELEGACAEIFEGRPRVIKSLNTFSGYERMTSYEIREGRASVVKTETGCFTHEKRAARTSSQTALCFAQALCVGLVSEARELLEPGLSSELDDGTLRHFFGDGSSALLEPEPCEEPRGALCGSIYELMPCEAESISETYDPESFERAVRIGVLGERDAGVLFNALIMGVGGSVIRPKRYSVTIGEGRVTDSSEL